MDKGASKPPNTMLQIQPLVMAGLLAEYQCLGFWIGKELLYTFSTSTIFFFKYLTLFLSDPEVEQCLAWHRVAIVILKKERI